MANRVLVAGASGLVGHAALREFAALEGWSAVGVSRRRPSGLDTVDFVSVDLTDEAACEATFGAMHDVTHLVYAALSEEPGLFAGWLDDAVIERNGRMLRNLFEPLSRAAKGLRHVSLLHGTKAYGLHHPSVGLAGVHIPLREREPRREHPNFYFVQEDYLHEKQRGQDWSITVFRPTVIYGDAPGNNMNPTLVIAAYASLLKEAGEPLHFPGSGDGPVLREAVDAGLVGRALTWAARSPEAAGGTYNVTNGDVFTWEHVWPAIAAEMGMDVGEQRPVSLAEFLQARAGDWAALVAKYNLTANPDLLAFAGYNSLVYTDMVMTAMNRGRIPALNSTIAIRQAGFHECIDTEDMFRAQIRALRAQRAIP